MGTGWEGTGSAYYDSEYQIGAFAGYDFGDGLTVSKAKFWLGRYSGQNITLIATVEYKDGNGNWQEAKDLQITTSISYPRNVFTVELNVERIWGLRWIHKKTPQKSPSNNITFFGMTLYGAEGVQVYIPDSSGLILPPAGYDGFGPLYLQ